MIGPRYIVVGGSNRLTTVYMVGDDTQEAATVAHLEKARDNGSPTLQWATFDVPEVRDIIGEVQDDLPAFRLRNGTIERRPIAFISLDNAAPVVGDTINVDCQYSAEPLTDKVVSVNGVTYSAPLSIECDEAGLVSISPISGPHLSMVYTLRVSE